MIEDVVDEIKAVLEENLQAELAALGVSDTVRRFLIAEEDIPPAELPAIFILPQRTAETPMLGNVHDEAHTLVVVARAEHVQPGELALKIFRFKAALRHALIRNLPHIPARFVGRIKVTRHDYTPTEMLDVGDFARDVLLECEVVERLMEK